MGYYKEESEKNTGFVYFSIEKVGDKYIGIVFFKDKLNSNPSFVFECEFSIENNTLIAVGKNIGFMNPIIYTYNYLKYYDEHFKNKDIVPNELGLRGEIKENNLSVLWATDKGVKGAALLNQSDMIQKSKIKAKKFRWKTFKKFVSEELDTENFIFRGQKDRWRLRSTFHRVGRSNLLRYADEDIRILRKNLIPHLSYDFDLDKKDHYGALLSLAQHHGYPTPFLDWSESPFVAAYFAFEGLKKKDESKGFVRIFIFNRAEWENVHPFTTRHVKTLIPHLEVVSFLPIENRRFMPQQSITTYCNMDDIETLIEEREKEHSKKYLEVIDLYREERSIVMKELRYMGITAGSLFPGKDGVCKDLRKRYFEE